MFPPAIVAIRLMLLTRWAYTGSQRDQAPSVDPATV